MDVKFEKDDAIINHLKEGIRNHNNEISPMHKASRAQGYVQHILITEKDQGQLVAGISARLYWEMIYLDEFYVEKDYRSQGLGRKLLDRLIEIGQDKRVNYIVLETYSFQARGFYEKFGFEVVGEIKDYPPGESFYTMRLDLK